MKRLFLFLPLALLIACGSPNEVNQQLYIYGNCTMCEKTIEGALSGIDGISLSDWNKTTKKMQLSYDTTQISLSEIKKKIVAVGYDLEDLRAKDEDYKQLHHCCQYKRPE